MVIVGEEVKTSQGEVIGLFLTEKIERGLSMAETIAEIQAQDGLVLMPHPFDRLHTIPDRATLHRLLDEIDIFEVYNSRLLFDSFNDDALRFAPSTTWCSRPARTHMCCRASARPSTASPPSTAPRSSWSRCATTRSSAARKSLLYLQGLKWMQQVGKTGS